MEELITESKAEIEPQLDEEAWRKHIQYSLNFMGSDIEYCRRNRIRYSTFKRYKSIFGATKSAQRKRRNFIKVESGMVTSNCDTPAKRDTVTRPLPNAQWTAELILALMAQR